ncbi:TapB family protein [Dyadobacter bucti]|uniref:TapB family protein n=1 Tax=Dyadobacter bucti TaxID=2572203 RepID=UPI003F6E87E8
MKKHTLLSFFLLIITSMQVAAQECAGIKMKQGGGFEMNNYDAKGKSIGKLDYKITKVETQGSNTVITIDMESFNNKGKSEIKNTYKMICDGKTLILDANSLISQEQLKSFQNMEMKFTYDNIEFPAQYTVGEKLKDASVKGTGTSGPMAVNFNMYIKNRNVASQEKLTIPAGTFDAYKINSDLNMEMVMGFPVKMEMSSVSYRAPGVIWDLKTETYRKGKLMGYSDLTKIY